MATNRFGRKRCGPFTVCAMKDVDLLLRADSHSGDLAKFVIGRQLRPVLDLYISRWLCGSGCPPALICSAMMRGDEE